MMRNERLQVIEEGGYKKGGRVKSKKDKAKKRKTTGKKKRTRARKATGKRARGGEGLKYAPLGGVLPTTGMSSTVFGAQQAPSYFRAVLPQQEYANIPDVLKGLKEGQEKIMKELEKRKQQVAADAKVAEKLEEKSVSPVVTRGRQRKRSPSIVRSGAVTPVEQAFPYGAGQDYSPYLGQRMPNLAQPLPFRPLSLALNTLNPLQRKPTTPEMIVPTQGSFRAPDRAISPSYVGPLSSKEAMSAEPYRGADPNIPLQAVASGEQMRPVDVNISASSDSAFFPLGASQPESIDDSAARAGSVAGDIGLPPVVHTPRGKEPYRVAGEVLKIKRPVFAPAASVPSVPSVAPIATVRTPESVKKKILDRLTVKRPAKPAGTD